ncbi:MAG: hypothetical protein HY815_13070 [Candidatus Riflebacteria bacterium]|nr:hypothetical protein [Candidatus Riflebacteria bacterium]
MGANDYRLAALERIAAAEQLCCSCYYPECIYVSGPAVECILRANHDRSDPALETGHDLRELLKASRLETFVPEIQRRRLGVALGEIWARWRNGYRYASAKCIRTDLRRRGLFTGVKGDALKYNARRALDCGHELVGLGCHRWSES